MNIKLSEVHMKVHLEVVFLRHRNGEIMRSAITGHVFGINFARNVAFNDQS